MPKMTYYDLLHVRPDAPDDAIRAAYRYLAKQYHPDTNPLDRNLASARFRLIQDAYENLRDPSRRKLYDQHLKMQAWYPQTVENDNRPDDFSDLFSTARKTIERLMRVMSATRNIPVTTSRPDGDHRG